MTERTLQKSDLLQFTGTSAWYRHWLSNKTLYTDGVKHVADMGHAYWLIDAIVIAQPLLPASAKIFQLWKLEVSEDGSAFLSCLNGDGEEVYRDGLSYTDFPLPEIKFYLTSGVLMLPSEY